MSECAGAVQFTVASAPPVGGPLVQSFINAVGMTSLRSPGLATPENVLAGVVPAPVAVEPPELPAVVGGLLLPFPPLRSWNPMTARAATRATDSPATSSDLRARSGMGAAPACSGSAGGAGGGAAGWLSGAAG